MAKLQGFPYDFRRMETLNFDRCNCPFCLSSDRERLYLIYLETHFESARRSYKILDFAPSITFAKNLRSRSNVDYTSADLMVAHVDVHVDICDMPSLNSETYDVVICSHVLEHVQDPAAALKEIKRVMTKTGIAIIMVPLFWDVRTTIEDSSHNTDALRLRHYGQVDHVRLYDRGTFLTQLENAGFTVEQVTPDKLNPEWFAEMLLPTIVFYTYAGRVDVNYESGTSNLER